MSRNSLLVIGVLAIIAIGLGFWISQNLIIQPEYVNSRYRGEARRNGFYAAERLLDRLGVNSRSVRQLSELPDSLDASDTLIASTPGYSIINARAAALLRWVENGGHLIFTVYRAYNPYEHQGANRLLDDLNLQVRETETGAGDLVDVILEDDEPPLQVRFRPGFYLQDSEDEAFWQVADDSGAHLLQYVRGSGLITVLSDLRIFNNRRLSNHDHADFLWQIIHLDNRQGNVWLQYAPQAPSLAQLLWQQAWMPIVALLITLLGVIWAYGQRLGPMLLPRNEGRRNLLEHVQASGRFLWRHGAGETLLAAERQRVLRTLERRHPSWQGLSVEEKMAHIAEFTGLEREQTTAAFNRSGKLSEREFLYIVQLLKQIENKV